MGESIVVTSGKGGVGKTTSSANLGCALALMENRVVLVDADIGLRNLDVVMGLENRIVFDLVDVVDGFCRFGQALIRDRRFSSLHLLPAAQTKDKTAVSPEQMRRLCLQLKKEFDYVIIDSPAGIEQGFKNAVAGADRAVVVTTPEVAAVRDADRIIGLLEATELEAPGLIINRIRPEMMRRREMMTVEEIVDILAVDLVGLVPEDEKIVKYANSGQPACLSEDSTAGQAYINIARRLVGEDIQVFTPFEGNGLLGRLKRLMGLAQ